ncbi:hypothetical protein HY404_01420 [Candidatus Microgenomates bacterium]|nr:hypothetical protein [Candidatus Microgenomates bacterium]
MILGRFLLIGIVLGVMAFLLLGPGRELVAANMQKVLGVTTENFVKSVPLVNLPAVFNPVEQASSTISDTISQIKNLPNSELDAIRSQICNLH